MFWPEVGSPTIKCKVLFDSGSQRTYVTNDLADASKAKILRRESQTIGTFGAKKNKDKGNVVGVELKGLRGSEVVKVEAVVVEKICSPFQGQKIDLSQAEEDICSGLELADKYDTEEAVEVKILIGLDYYWSIIKGGVVRLKNSPVALESKFGLILSGSVEAPNREYTHCYVSNATITNLMVNIDHCTQDGVNVSRSLDRFWGLDGLGIVDDEMDIEFKVDIQFDGEKYVVELTRKVYRPGLEDNYRLARKRLTSLLRRLKKDPGQLKRYAKIMEGMSYAQPPSCDLPDYRVIGKRAFLTSGVDLAGPVYIEDAKSRVMSKGYKHSFFYKQGTIFPEPQLCLLNHENQPHYMLMLCLYKSFMSTFVEWLIENFILCLHCNVFISNVYHATAFLIRNSVPSNRPLKELF